MSGSTARLYGITVHHTHTCQKQPHREERGAHRAKAMPLTHTKEILAAGPALTLLPAASHTTDVVQP
eukprot:3253705-Prymnesium_polylepis.1